jgi:hypothetical protein
VVGPDPVEDAEIYESVAALVPGSALETGSA